MSSPTQRTLAELRKRGYLAAVVEHWNPHAKIRQDLFGIVDVLAIGRGFGARCPMATCLIQLPAATLAVQATTGAHVAARVAKLQAAPATPQLLAAGWLLEVWGWRKLKKTGRWELRVVAITADATSPLT